MQLPVNTLLQGGKYRIVRFINSGGFGCTYEAEHVAFQGRVAIKEFFVRDFCGRDELTSYVTIETTNKRALVDKLKQKFIDEARSIFNLHHPGIVRVTDVFEENGTAYYVMDYINGKSLKELVDEEGALPEFRALGYIRQVADALRYVHAHNRLHLDIKPGNIMVDENDRAMLIDFGTSKQYDEVNGENTSTLLGHTAGYAPPEQIGNDLVKFTPATDIYALGATLYKLLSGVTPVGVNLLISGERLTPLSGSVTSSVRHVVENSMRVNRYDRPQSVDAFLSLLDSSVCNDDEGTVVDDVSPTLPVSKTSSKRPGWLIPLTICLLTALCILGFRECRDLFFGGEHNDSLFVDSLAHVDTIPVRPSKNDEPSEPRKDEEVISSTCPLYVTTSPAGALVYVDGKKIGKSPIEGMDISPGKHTIKMVLDGYETFTKKYIFADRPLIVNEALVSKIAAVVPTPAPVKEDPSKPAPLKVATTGVINGHAYVDLGLSVKWATMNVGADSPDGYGDYFAWGEVHPKSEYSEETSLTYEKKMGDIIGNSKYDAARYHWGGSWRLPSKKEFEELRIKCTWIWIIQAGHKGFKVVGPNGNSIFLPASGYRRDEIYETSVEGVGAYGYYWIGSPHESVTRKAYCVNFFENTWGEFCYHRYFGQSVRPVSD